PEGERKDESKEDGGGRRSIHAMRVRRETSEERNIAYLDRGIVMKTDIPQDSRLGAGSSPVPTTATRANTPPQA
ncbi:MAG: hypothetical protein ACO394_12330, partial [Blastocatellia bacterium]